MNPRPWTREPLLALVIGLPLAAVIAGFVTLALAAGGAKDRAYGGVRRVAQTQTRDLSADHAAAQLGLQAVATIGADGTVALRFYAGVPQASALRLELRHGTDPRRDRMTTLARLDDTAFVGSLSRPRATGAYNVELSPAHGGWRLVGRLEAGASRVRLEAALDG
jgi:hypothetical protein